MHAFMRELFPICRSITGDGVRETLAAVARRTPLELNEVPSGTKVLDWTVPDEWNISDAYIAKDGHRVVDFRESNLHVVSYSEPVRTVMPLADGLRDDVNRDGVSVISVYTGRTATPMQVFVHEHEARPYRPEMLLRPEDVVDVVLAALSVPPSGEVTDVSVRPIPKLPQA